MGVSQLLGCACPGCPPKVYAYAVHIVFKYLLYLSICIAPLNSHGQTYYRYACYNLRYVRLIIKAKILLLLFQSVIAKQIVIFRFFHGICLYPWHVVIGWYCFLNVIFLNDSLLGHSGCDRQSDGDAFTYMGGREAGERRIKAETGQDGTAELWRIKVSVPDVLGQFTFSLCLSLSAQLRSLRNPLFPTKDNDQHLNCTSRPALGN